MTIELLIDHYWIFIQWWFLKEHKSDIWGTSKITHHNYLPKFFQIQAIIEDPNPFLGHHDKITKW
jgi:hypothetical protein